ncbi:unnamed protein product [Spirodela intermedia]|uniref:Uncharacterized protein n=1 Tax=Spirodela intermedia TaxID=51605 RepID=A0A7I8ITQ9_SPIIN|nr:unnamed protein product [Spirodela intermedia]CAA6661186.1 unnamed protein product [Spirodela intermedia]
MQRDAGILLALICILLASPAALVSTAGPEHATYEKVRSALAVVKLRGEGTPIWPVDWWQSDKRHMMVNGWKVSHHRSKLS